MQKTIKSAVSCTGVGLHSGQDITMTFVPAQAGSGIVFVRTDLPEGENVIPALWNHVVDTQLCTVIANEHGARVGTIEHVMAALRGIGVDNVVIEINGAEAPIMDGSSMPFINMIETAGIEVQDSPRRVIKVLKEVSVEEDGKTATLRPGDVSVFGGSIDFNHPSIGHQHFEMELVNGNFKHDLAEARTFGFLKEVEWMRSQGLARGGSLDNAIVLDEETVMNTDGLRYRDEFIRHKLLDAIGDIYLAGAPILGVYDSSKSGHGLNNKLLRKLFATPGAFEVVEQETVPVFAIPASKNAAVLESVNA